ncbi:MAG: carboxypeptidase C (cathepsin A) [Myxococcota bacterium]|jgi:carboxypeptidase C (cathepsin A)
MPDSPLPAGSVVIVTSPDKALSAALARSAAPKPKEEPKEVTTSHVLARGSAAIPYDATVGTLTVKRGEATGTMFYTAYRRTDVGDATGRPLLFAFNGGPGSASLWLHMGVFGPARVSLDVDDLRPPPWVAEPNPDSLLDRADLVFVDPIGTGWSKAEGEGKEFYSVEGDVESVAEFVRQYVAKHGRWGSPILLAGESYGTTRCAGLAQHLADKHGLAVRGLVLLSVALKFDTLLFGPNNVLPPVLLLPTCAATAHYHGLITGDLPALLAEVETFALDTYLPALVRGGRLAPAERRALAEQIAGYIGVSADFVERCNLRPTLMRYCKELLRDRRRTVGRLDSRFTGVDRDAGGDSIEHDPSLSFLMGPYTAAYHHHLRHSLGWEEDAAYAPLSLDVNRGWSWEPHVNQYVDVTERLRSALVANPHLEVFAGSGLYDMATPYFATDYTLAQVGWEPELADRMVHESYAAGHMMYLHPPSLDKLRADLDRWLDRLGL